MTNHDTSEYLSILLYLWIFSHKLPKQAKSWPSFPAPVIQCFRPWQMFAQHSLQPLCGHEDWCRITSSYIVGAAVMCKDGYIKHDKVSLMILVVESIQWCTSMSPRGSIQQQGLSLSKIVPQVSHSCPFPHFLQRLAWPALSECQTIDNPMVTISSNHGPINVTLNLPNIKLKGHESPDLSLLASTMSPHEPSSTSEYFQLRSQAIGPGLILVASLLATAGSVIASKQLCKSHKIPRQIAS